jgi:hypothetical protein
LQNYQKAPPIFIEEGGIEDMGNKKVFVIPPARTFSRYVGARDGMLRLAVYTEGQLPLETVQMCFANILKQTKNCRVVGVYTDDDNSGKNKNDFRKLLKLCEGRKVDMIICRSQEDLPEKTMLLNEMGVPIYVLEDGRIIDHEVGLDFLTQRMSC